MRKYETVVIYGSELPETRVKEEITKIESFLKERGATVETNRWGAKQMSFSIKKRKSGHYVSFAYDTDATDLPTLLNAYIKISDIAIRFQTHRLGLPQKKIKPRPGQTDATDDYDDDYSVSY